MVLTHTSGQAAEGLKNPPLIIPRRQWPRTTVMIPKPLAISRESSRKRTRERAETGTDGLAEGRGIRTAGSLAGLDFVERSAWFGIGVFQPSDFQCTWRVSQ